VTADEDEDAFDALRRVLQSPDRGTLRRHLRRTSPTGRLPVPPERTGAIELGSLLRPDDAAEDERRARRPGWRSAVVVAGVATALVGVTAVRPMRSGNGTAGGGAAEDGRIEVAPEAPADGEGPASTTSTTAVRLWPAEPVEVAGQEVRSGGHAWTVGSEGDVIAVGDWDCDRLPTPAVLRPGTGAVAVFDRWATEDTVTEARPVDVVAGGVQLRAGERCGELVVTTDDGEERTVATNAAGAP
jgi:hypothetical protein